MLSHGQWLLGENVFHLLLLMTASNRNAVTICVKRWRGLQREKSNFWVVFFVAKKHESGRFSGKKMRTIWGSFSGKYNGSKGSRCKYVDSIASDFHSFGKVVSRLNWRGHSKWHSSFWLSQLRKVRLTLYFNFNFNKQQLFTFDLTSYKIEIAQQVCACLN